jgi:DNA-binding MarR family transcriptional regulator
MSGRSAGLTNDDAQSDIERRANDETRCEAEQRQNRESSDAKLRQALDDPKRCRAAYRDIAELHTALTHAQFRVLSYLLRQADPDLTNAFPSQKTAAEALGMQRPTYNRHLVALRDAGWVRTHEFQYKGDQTSSGVQFCIPAEVLPLGEPWAGLAQFDKRLYGTPKRARRRREESAQSTGPVVHLQNNGNHDSRTTETTIREQRIP